MKAYLFASFIAHSLMLASILSSGEASLLLCDSTSRKLQGVQGGQQGCNMSCFVDCFDRLTNDPDIVTMATYCFKAYGNDPQVSPLDCMDDCVTEDHNIDSNSPVRYCVIVECECD